MNKPSLQCFSNLKVVKLLDHLDRIAEAKFLAIWPQHSIPPTISTRAPGPFSKKQQ